MCHNGATICGLERAKPLSNEGASEASYVFVKNVHEKSFFCLFDGKRSLSRSLDVYFFVKTVFVVFASHFSPIFFLARRPHFHHLNRAYLVRRKEGREESREERKFASKTGPIFSLLLNKARIN